MNITYIPQRLELVFWSAVIPLMTESSTVGRLIKIVYKMINIARRVPPVVWLALSVTSGLAFGLGLAVLGMIIFA